MSKIVPLVPSVMQQFRDIKQKHPDAIILFRQGSFYQCFEDDAENVSRVCGVTLIAGQGKPKSAIFPYHALDIYLPKLVRAGFRMAICDASLP